MVKKIIGVRDSPTSRAPSTSEGPATIPPSRSGCGGATARRREPPTSRRGSPLQKSSMSAAPCTSTMATGTCGEATAPTSGTVMVKDIAPAGSILGPHRRRRRRVLPGLAGWPSTAPTSCGEATGPRRAQLVKHLDVEPGRLRPHRLQGQALLHRRGRCGAATGPRKERPSSRATARQAGARLRCFSGLTATGDDTLYLVGSDKRYGGELWRSNGTRKGTKIVSDIRRGCDTSLPMYLTAVNHTLFFAAKDGKHGRELWKVKPSPCKKTKGKCKKG